MGKEFRPQDVVKRKKVIDEAVRDLSPGIGGVAKEILSSWNGNESEKKLTGLLGREQTQKILKKVQFKGT
jgi:hypothetical protein